MTGGTGATTKTTGTRTGTGIGTGITFHMERAGRFERALGDARGAVDGDEVLLVRSSGGTSRRGSITRCEVLLEFCDVSELR